jgi:hypothetical protein
MARVDRVREALGAHRNVSASCLPARLQRPSLTRRPVQRPPRKHVQMKMENGLAGVRALVDDDAIARRGGVATGARGDREEVADFVRFGGGDEVTEVDGVAFGDHEEVLWRLRVEVFEHERIVRAVHFAAGDLAAKNLAKEAVRIAIHAYVPAFGYMVMKLNDESGLAVTPPTEVLAANDTTECASAIAGASWPINAFAAR